MAKVTITFEDGEEDGIVHTQVAFDPPAQADALLTSAQSMGLTVLRRIREEGIDDE